MRHSQIARLRKFHFVTSAIALVVAYKTISAYVTVSFISETLQILPIMETHMCEIFGQIVHQAFSMLVMTVIIQQVYLQMKKVLQQNKTG
jgi:Ni,Fe-hydrogenase I cytochrome b subunit